MVPAQRKRASIRRRRQERELAFWTVREVLKLIVFVVAIAFLIEGLFDGRVFGIEHLMQLIAP
ncbi:MAG TPA: hypothetical protein VMD09_10105 [Solirubrobacteraceae bacterium]|nr:hypothetical protein [Solirubrobacteraceae bacterium]